MSAPTLSLPTLIPAPAGFPVQWPDEESARAYWTRDREHMPRPVTPMFSSVAPLTAGEGHRRAARVYEEPVLEMRGLTVNTYLYMNLTLFDGEAAELERRVQRNRSLLLATALHLDELWEQKWRPHLEKLWAFWAAFDPQTAGFSELATHLDDSLARAIELYEIHYLMGAPMWFAIDEFTDFYTDLFPGSTALDAHRLLQGFDNHTLRLNRALWQLSRLALGHAGLRRAIECQPASALYVWLQIVAAQDKTFHPFQQALRAFLTTYGRRSDLWDWGYPSWQDDPTPVFSNLKNYLRQADRDLSAELAQAAAERENAVSTARRALHAYPQAVRARFEKLLRAAQTALVMSEDHTYYIDFNGTGWLHRLVREFGVRFTRQGRLRRADDVFYLHLAELRRMIAQEGLDLSALAAGRRQEAETWGSYDEPPELGCRPARPLYAYSPQARRMLRYLGAGVDETPPSPSQAGVVCGQPASAGRVRGRARCILSLADAGRLQPGDILVTTTTAPPWTALFLSAAALVTDAGGLLSHGAVVAREMRIPAVVGTRHATRLIRDGQWIEVDGNAGQVWILNEEV